MDHQGENALNFMLFKIKKNIKKTEIFLKNTAIPTSWTDPSKVAEPSDVCDKPYDLPYGVAANIHDSEACTTKLQRISRPLVSVKDHTLNTEAFILSFIAENSLPLSKVPRLVEFAKFLSRDVSALNGVKMDRTAATYKLRGLSYHNHEELVNKMIKYLFGINMDDCTYNSNKRIFDFDTVF